MWGGCASVRPRDRGCNSSATGGQAPGRSGHVRRARQELLDLDRDAVATYHDGAAGDRQAVGEDADLVILGRVELDDGAAAEPQHLVDWHGRGAQNHRNVNRDVVEFGHEPSGIYLSVYILAARSHWRPKPLGSVS